MYLYFALCRSVIKNSLPDFDFLCCLCLILTFYLTFALFCLFMSHYMCNQCLLTVWFRIPLMARCTRYNIIWYSLSVTCGRSVIFSGYSGFLHQWNWPPRYSGNIVERGVKHHNPDPIPLPAHVVIICGFFIVQYTNGCIRSLL